jgi:TATA-binding protein-associated factor
MSLPTNHAVLAEMYVSCNEAPWHYPRWQELTGIRHGLFPAEDSLLPFDWTREVANSIHSYLDVFSKKGTQQARAKSSKAMKLPGRTLWVQFCVKIWDLLEIHSRISLTLAENMHHITSVQHTPNWPFSSFYNPEVLGSVGVELFGVDALDDIARRDLKLGSSLVLIISNTWINLRILHEGARNAAFHMKRAAVKSFKGKGRGLSNSFGAMLNFIRSRGRGANNDKSKCCPCRSRPLEGSLPRA